MELKLFKMLGIKSYTRRHFLLVSDFIKNKDTNIEKILNELGGWDENDLQIAKSWQSQLPTENVSELNAQECDATDAK